MGWQIGIDYCKPVAELSCEDRNCPGRLAVFKAEDLGAELGVEEDGGPDQALAWTNQPMAGCKCNRGIPSLRNEELGSLEASDSWNAEVVDLSTQRLVEAVMSDFILEKGNKMSAGQLVHYKRLAAEYSAEKYGSGSADFSTRLDYSGCCAPGARCDDCRPLTDSPQHSSPPKW